MQKLNNTMRPQGWSGVEGKGIRVGEIERQEGRREGGKETGGERGGEGIRVEETETGGNKGGKQKEREEGEGEEKGE